MSETIGIDAMNICFIPCPIVCEIFFKLWNYCMFSWR